MRDIREAGKDDGSSSGDGGSVAKMIGETCAEAVLCCSESSNDCPPSGPDSLAGSDS